MQFVTIGLKLTIVIPWSTNLWPPMIPLQVYDLSEKKTEVDLNKIRFDDDTSLLCINNVRDSISKNEKVLPTDK